MAAALFDIDDDTYVPTELARGPWTPDALHGGPPCALLTRAVEAVEAPSPMHLARATFELLRPVPVAPLTVTTEVVRPGRNVQLVAASLHAGDVEVARAVALRMRVTDLPLPDGVAVDAGRPDLPAAAATADVPFSTSDYVAFHRDGVEIRPVAGGFDRAGPGTAWFRLRVPVVAGEEPSGAVRATAVADFGNGLSWVLRDGWTFLNADLTVNLLRPAAGSWVCLASRTLPSTDGIALAESALYDERGRLGRSTQSLLLQPPR